MNYIGAAGYVVATIDGDFGVAGIVEFACTREVDNVDIIVAMNIDIA